MSGIVGNNLGRASGLIKAASVSLGNDSIDSQHYVDASIDNAFLADGAVDTQEIADNAITLAKMAGGTDGNIISFDASGDPVAIATGSDGQVLTSTGAGSPPAFEAAAGGGNMVLVGSGSGTSNVSSVDIDDVFSATYKNYMAVFKILPETAGDDLKMILRDSGGDRNEAKYNWNHNQSYSKAAGQGTQMTNYGVQQTTMTLMLDVASDADWGNFTVLWMFDPLRTTGNNPSWMWFNTSQTTTLDAITGGLGAARHSEATSTNTGFKLYMDGDDIGRHYYYVYGLKES